MTTVYDQNNPKVEILPAGFQPQPQAQQQYAYQPQAPAVYMPQPQTGYQKAPQGSAVSVLDLNTLGSLYQSQEPSKVMKEAAEGIEQITRYSLKARTGTLVKMMGEVPLETPQLYYRAIFVGVSNLQRIYYKDGYDPATKKNKKPTCFSPDGEFPDPNVPDANWPRWFNSQTQKRERVVSCAQCPFSKKQPGEQASACRYQKEAAIIFPDDPQRIVYSFKISASSLFGDEDGVTMPFQDYVNALANHNARIERLITNISASSKVTFAQTRFFAEAMVDPADFPVIDNIVASNDVETLIKRTPSYDTSGSESTTRSPVIDVILSHLDANYKAQYSAWIATQPFGAAADEYIINNLKQYFPAIVAQAYREVGTSTQAQPAPQPPVAPHPQAMPNPQQFVQQQQPVQQPVQQPAAPNPQQQQQQQQPAQTQAMPNPQQFAQQQPVQMQTAPQPPVAPQPQVAPNPQQFAQQQQQQSPAPAAVMAAPASASPSPTQSAMNAGAAPSPSPMTQAAAGAAFAQMFPDTDFSHLKNFDQ